MHFLVTGGAGFIGRNLTEQLLKNGHKVTCLDNFLTSNEKNIEAFKGDNAYDFVLHDVKNPLPFKESFDYVFHLAAPASPEFYYNDPIDTFETIMKGAFNILQYLNEYKVPCIYTSTSEVYGDPLEHPQKESYLGNVNPIGLRSCYDEAKRASESIIFDHIRQNKVSVKVIRVFNTYGPYMHPKDGRVVSNFIMQALKNEPITVYGDGLQTRSFQYIDDLVEAMIKLIDTPSDFFGPINLGNPQEFTIKELAETVLSLMPNSTSEIVYKDLPQDDPTKRKPDITLAKSVLNWEPQVQLNEGLKKSIAYFEAKYL